MNYFIEIKVDTNDADYATEVNLISEEDLEKLKPLFEKVKNFKPYTGKHESGREYTHHHNFPTQDCYRKDLGEKYWTELYAVSPDSDLFYLVIDIIPPLEHGFHTIKSIYVYPEFKKEQLL